MPRVLITGANGNIGRRLLQTLADDVAGNWTLRAFVRSERAQQQLPTLPGTPVDVAVGSYTDRLALAAAAQDCDAVVHLVGIIKENRANSFADAHVASTATLVEAMHAAQVPRAIYLSILGARADHSNPCLRTKAEAETLLQNGVAEPCLLRVPMVLGEGDYASAALIRRAMKSRSVALRADSLEQPIYVGDVVAAITAGLTQSLAQPVFDLAGPESLTRRALVDRTAAILGRRSSLLSLPIGLGLAAAGLLERISANPPVTRAMLGVLDHDDRIDPAPAAAALGIELTPLDEALRQCIAAFQSRAPS